MKHSSATKKTKKKTTRAKDAPIPFRPTDDATTRRIIVNESGFRDLVEKIEARDNEIRALKAEISTCTPAGTLLEAVAAERIALQGAIRPTVDTLENQTIGDLVVGALGSDWRGESFADGMLDAIASEVNVLDAAMFEHPDGLNENDLRVVLQGLGNRARYGAELARRIARARETKAGAA